MPPLTLDHVALVVPDTEASLRLWRDRFGLAVRTSEIVAAGGLRLTHLHAGGTELQLVEPLQAQHPLRDWLAHTGGGLHHICFRVADLEAVLRSNLGRPSLPPHPAVGGRRAVFLDVAGTDGVRVELVGP